MALRQGKVWWQITQLAHHIWYIESMTSGELVRATRKRQRVTQAQLALRAGTSQNAVSRIERGDVSPSVETIERLLAAMGERLELSVKRIEGEFDTDHLADSMKQTMSERLERSFAWNRFAGRLAGVARSGAR
jgi:transcriptional regulator with XRE-family HTH domain